MIDDGMLSQDEIDALLNIGSDDYDENNDQVLTSIEEDTIGEIGNISFGSSATTLSTLLGQKVEITTPEVSIVSRADINATFNFDHVCVSVQYVAGFSGDNLFVIKTHDAAVIADIMLGGTGENPESELNEIHLSAVQEAMNQMMGTAATSMSTVFEKKVDISPPKIETKTVEELEKMNSLGDNELLVKVAFQLKVGDLVDSKIMQVIPFPFAKEMANELLDMSQAEREISATETVIGEQEHDVINEQPVSVTQVDQKVQQSSQFIGQPVNKGNAHVEKAVLSEFPNVQLEKQEQRNLDMLLDIPLRVTVELGRTRRTVKDILSLTSGSIVELDKLAGEPVDILVNEKLIAKGEVVVIDENFGVRITDIMNQSDRIMNLK
ncbi:MAG TPA: flagellar motor switch phosphatase FliY [Cerasibacillus sp.]|uniref:flagellar motor switch phosphatase FliY n=1 Tax=Cerasibacillus sp. TaxID=2498711 RepID=UPI002F3F35C5